MSPPYTFLGFHNTPPFNVRYAASWDRGKATWRERKRRGLLLEGSVEKLLSEFGGVHSSKGANYFMEAVTIDETNDGGMDVLRGQKGVISKRFIPENTAIGQLYGDEYLPFSIFLLKNVFLAKQKMIAPHVDANTRRLSTG